MSFENKLSLITNDGKEYALYADYQDLLFAYNQLQKKYNRLKDDTRHLEEIINILERSVDKLKQFRNR